MAQRDFFSLKTYYGGFRTSFSGIIAGITGILPLVGWLIPTAGGAYLFPPLGGADVPARGGVVLLAFLGTYAAFFSQHKPLRQIRKAFFWVPLFALVFLGAYIGLHSRFVRHVNIPTRDVTVQVSVGYERTPFAESTFGTVSDWELLRQRGMEEEEINRLWTLRSLLVVRLALFLAYSGVIVPFVVGFSFGVVYDLKNRLSA